FDGTGLQWTNSYAEDGFLITAVDSGSGVDGFFVGSERLWKVNPSRSEELLFTHFDDAHNDLAFDLVSLDIDLLWGESIITSSSGASLSLSDFGLGTANFDTVGWWNITSFSIENSGIFAIDNIVFENPATIVPEPSTFVLLGGGLVGLAFFARRKKNS
ncbi:MAG: hypothetical protein DRH08_06385, partial [Deltaproteobacteria bacterium]